MSQTHATVGDLLELGFTVEEGGGGYVTCHKRLNEGSGRDVSFCLEAAFRETGYMYDACIGSYIDKQVAGPDVPIYDRTREGFVKLLSCLDYSPHSSQTPSDPSRGE